MRLLKIGAAAALALLGVSAGPAQGPAPVTSAAPALEQSALPAAVPSRSGGVALTRTDVEAWLDGFVPFALARADIAGAVVVVVQDDAVLSQKGYGYADVQARKPVSPETTLFRPGSVSKLFTWTAVMQQVEQGKLDLDRDVNDYLDFKIPPYDGKPITLRNIMTHTAGFEEAARYTIMADGKDMMPLGELMKLSLPARIFPPGVTPAYSNYATALAGYIVERVSGQSFDDYMEQHVMRPIGMARATFRQPLPPRLEPFMSKGYALASQDPKGFEFVGPAPAGSLSASGAEMARFMMAHLAQGRGLLRPETARMLHNTMLTIVPPLNRMALGFYEQNINGRRVIGHGGDTQYFHSYLWLFPDENVGVYLSVNSAGKDGATRPLRNAFFQQFADRYFPDPPSTARVDEATARQHAAMMAGSYSNSRGFHTVFLNILDLLGQVKLGVDENGDLVAAAVTGTADQQRKWVEVAPFVWKDRDSEMHLAAKVVDGKVVRWSWDEVSPFMMFDRVPWYRDSSWLLPATIAAIGILALTALAWPIGAIARRRYKAPLALEGRRLKAFRWLRIFAALAVMVLVGWIAFVTIILQDLGLLSQVDWMIWTLQILSPIAFFGFLGLAAWNLWVVWKEKTGWFTRIWSVLLVLAGLVLLWVALAFHLIGLGTNF